MVTDEPPLLAAGWRFSIAGLLLLAFAWWRGGPPVLTRIGLLVGLAGVMLVLAPKGGFHLAGLGWLLLDKTLSWVQIAGMTVILLGIALVTGYLAPLPCSQQRKGRRDNAFFVSDYGTSGAKALPEFIDLIQDPSLNDSG